MTPELNFTSKIKLDQLKARIKLFRNVPSATNLILAFNDMEGLILFLYKLNRIDIDTKNIERFDKLKNLALGTNFIEERKLAFAKSLEGFNKITGIEI